MGYSETLESLEELNFNDLLRLKYQLNQEIDLKISL